MIRRDGYQVALQIALVSLAAYVCGQAGHRIRTAAPLARHAPAPRAAA